MSFLLKVSMLDSENGKTCADGGTGYKEYKTERTYMALMGNWRDDKDREIPLDGIGGVNILVKADVHRSGKSHGRLPSRSEADMS